MKHTYMLSIKIIESGKPFLPVISLGTNEENDSTENLLNAASMALSKVMISANRVETDQYGNVKNIPHTIMLNSCIWQYLEELEAFVGYAHVVSEYPVNILCCLKEI